jgi:hypothetical protein
VAVSAAALVYYTMFDGTGDVIGGWSLEPAQLKIGFIRVMFPFFGGLLLSKTASIVKVKNAFFWCSLLVIVVLSLPRFGGEQHLWMNGLYESLSIILVFPLKKILGLHGHLLQQHLYLLFCLLMLVLNYMMNR